MKISKTEKLVIDRLAEIKIGTKAELCQYFNISHMTVIRALEKYGYYSSFNKNSSYYTLHDIPEFNSYGLWFHEGIGFSKYKNIGHTIVSIIERSKSGYSEKEMTILLQTQSGNILSRLVKSKQLDIYSIGRRVIYISANKLLGRNQSEQIEQNQESIAGERQQYNFTQAILPDNIELNVVIDVLVHLIKAPQSTVASISIGIQRKGGKVNASAVREILSFYGIKKSRNN